MQIAKVSLALLKLAVEEYMKKFQELVKKLTRSPIFCVGISPYKKREDLFRTMLGYSLSRRAQYPNLDTMEKMRTSSGDILFEKLIK